MHCWSRQSIRKPDLCDMHDKGTVGQKSWDLLVRVRSQFWTPPCAQVLPLPSNPSRTNAQHKCPPGRWFDLLAKAGWPVGIPMTPVPKVQCPLFTWADTRISECAGDTLGVRSPLSFTPRTTSANSLTAEVRVNQPFLFMVGYFRKKSLLLRTRRAQLTYMCWLTPPARDLARSILSNIFYQSGKKELFVLITSWHQE